MSLQKGFVPILIVTLIAVLAIAGGYLLYQKSQTPKIPPPEDQVICIQDVKLCPDGTSVGRVGPKCEFTPCSSPTTSSELELIKKACAKKEQDDISKVIMTISNPSSNYAGKFAAGSYHVQNVGGGSKWLAAKVNDLWVCPLVGNGIPFCSEVDPYNFPVALIDSCRDSSDTLINRSTRMPIQ